MEWVQIPPGPTMKETILECATFLQTHWLTILGTYRATLQARVDMERQLLHRFGESGRYALTDWKENTDLSDIFKSFTALLVRRFEQELCHANDGAVPTVTVDAQFGYGKEPSYRDHHDLGLDEFNLLVIEHAEKRSLVAVAEHLLERFTPEAARAAALTEAAARVKHYFEPPRWKSTATHIEDRGRIRVISRTLYWESFESWVASYNERNSIVARIEDMALLLVAQGVPGTIQLTNELSAFARSGHYSSRRKMTAGPGLTLVLFRDKIEWQFSPQALDAVQIAIATLAEPALSEAP